MSVHTENEQIIEKKFREIIKLAIIDGLGLSLFITSILLTGGNPNKFIFSFYTIIMVIGNVSGAHINPAVTFGLWIYNGRPTAKHHLAKLFSYIFLQFGFALLSAFLSRTIYNAETVNFSTKFDDFRVFLIEAVFTGTLIFIVLFINTVATRPTETTWINGLIVTLWLYFMINANDNISGGSYNPAVYFGLNIVSYYYGNDKALSYLPIMMTAPFVGSLIFTLMFKYIFKPMYETNNRKLIHEIED